MMNLHLIVLTNGIVDITLTMNDHNANVTTCDSKVRIVDEFGACCPDTLFANHVPLDPSTYRANNKVISEKIVQNSGSTFFYGGEDMLRSRLRSDARSYL